MNECKNCGIIKPGKAVHVDKNNRCIECGTQILNSFDETSKQDLCLDIHDLIEHGKLGYAVQKLQEALNEAVYTSNAKWKERLGQLKEALELAKYSIRGPLPDQYEEGEHDSDFKEDVALAKDAYKKTCEALQTLHKLLEGEG